jgi:hypothetical protein
VSSVSLCETNEILSILSKTFFFVYFFNFVVQMNLFWYFSAFSASPRETYFFVVKSIAT